MSLRTVVLVAAVFACVAMAAVRPAATLTFEQYVQQYGKGYVRGSEEYNMRKQIFQENLEMINAHNADGSKSWKMGVSHMTDYSTAEVKRMNGFKRTAQPPQPEKVHAVPAGFQAPLTVDYRTAQPPVLTAVKHQGCGDCWAHSATEAIESAFAKFTGNLNVLSQQQISSCSNMSSCPEDGMGGCLGGDPKLAVKQVADFGGLHDVWVYPYSNWQAEVVNGNQQAAKCQLPHGLKGLRTPVVSTTGFTAIPINDDAAMVHALATVGPVGVIVAAEPWMHYQGGVWSMPTNTSDPNYAIRYQLDHAVQLVGYGFDYDVQKHYWIVRNSWSPEWGEHGFIRIERFPGKEPCGTDTPQAVFCDSPKTSATVCGTSGILSDAFYANVKSNYPQFPPQ